jgi:uncharacterized protein YoxC
MTSPGGEHISRYRALGEFDSLIREAKKAQRALRELREEEAKLNAQSMAEDKKLAASKADRAKAEQASAESAKKSVADLGKNKAVAEKSGEDTATSFSRGMGRKIEQDSRSGSNNQFLQAATKALSQAFANAGDESGGKFVSSTKQRIQKDAPTIATDSSFDRTLKNIQDKFSKSGNSTGNSFIQGFATKLRELNGTLSVLGFDKLDLDVDISDARQSMKAIEFELNKLGHETANPQVRIDTTRALANLRAVQKLFKDEVAEDIIKESKRIQDELKVIDGLPSGRAFKFWALTALSDMTRVFKEADRGTGVFERLKRSITASGGGGGGNFIQSFVSGFDDFSEASSNLLQRLSRVSGELYRMPGIIGVIVSAIPALVAGLGALGGGALGVTSALGSLVGFLAAGPGVATAFIGAVGGVGQAFGGMGKVLKDARQALDEQSEAQEKARLGTDKALTATQKYNLALKELDPATQKVTEAFVNFSTKYAESQKKVGENFFKEVADQTDRLNQLLPISENFFGKSAQAVGKLADQGIRMITSGPWKRDFAIIAKDNAVNIENMGKAGFSLANVFRNITVAAGPFTQWVTKGLKEGAKAFADWSAEARSDGTIADFLAETSETGKILWKILKDLGNVINSFFQSSVDSGQDYLKMLQGITSGWAAVAEKQEAANSPLRKWLQDIKPVLTAMGDLIAAVATGLGKMASNQNNLQSIIDLLKVLQTQVLPPILAILQHLGDSGITVTIAKALGDMLDAIAHFLDSGATTALTVFVTVLANFFELLFNIASLPGVSQVLGGVASALAALAAVSIVARFTGLFKLWDFFTWMVRNKGNLSGAFADAARGAAGLSTVGGQQALPKNIPSTVGSVGIGSEVIEAQTRATNTATASTGRFSTALRGLRSAGSAASSAIAGAATAIGPLGLAIGAATIALGYFMSQAAEQKAKVESLQTSLSGLSDKYRELSETGEQAGSTADAAFRDIIKANPELQQTILLLNGLGVSFDDMVAAATGGDPSAVISSIDKEMARLNEEMVKPGNFFQIFDNEKRANKIKELGNAKDAFLANAKAMGVTTEASRILNEQETRNNYLNNAFANYVGPVSIGMREKLAAAYDNNASKIDALQGFVNVLSNAESSASDKANALRKVINSQTGAIENNIETSETWRKTIFDLRDAVNANGKSLSLNSREGLRNRDALEAAAKATRELYLQDIASGTPMDKALKRHQDRIKELQKEADKAFGTKKQTKDLINTYGDVPDDVQTDIKTTGYAKVYQQMQDLKALQASLQSGKSLSEATREVEEAKARANAHGYATGGPVWGPGTRTSDSIRAWLSNGEFVQPTDAVEHYGMPIMEALRTRKIDRAALQSALTPQTTSSENFATGGAAHSNNCPSCASGGHKFANGGSVDWPYPVDTSDTLVKKSWADVGGPVPGAGGKFASGWKNQLNILHRAGFNFHPSPGQTYSGGHAPNSWHYKGRAVDLSPPNSRAWEFLVKNYARTSKELYWASKRVNYRHGQAVGPRDKTNHIHWAYNQGGLVDTMKQLGLDNIAPTQQQAPIPSTPRTLSPAASSVVNNNTDSGTTFGDVIINNPVAERGGDSIRAALYRAKYLV